MYAYNDAVFTDLDWSGIRKFGVSVKEKDPMKIGRFGVGFKSVFHLTGKTFYYINKKHTSPPSSYCYFDTIEHNILVESIGLADHRQVKCCFLCGVC